MVAISIEIFNGILLTAFGGLFELTHSPTSPRGIEEVLVAAEARLV
jgi:hypothetical protein